MSAATGIRSGSASRCSDCFWSRDRAERRCAVRNGAKIRVHQTSWMDPVRCRGDVTCVCLQARGHARHVLSEQARHGAERGEERRNEKEEEVIAEGRQSGV